MKQLDLEKVFVVATTVFVAVAGSDYWSVFIGPALLFAQRCVDKIVLENRRTPHRHGGM